VTPLLDRQRQSEALLALYGSLTHEHTPSVFPDDGEITHLATGIRWNWATRPKRGNASITLLENRLSLGRVDLTYRIPLGLLDINDLGLLAQDSAGVCYVCRQKFTNRNRTDPDEAEAFVEGWTGPSFRTFNVKGRSSTRTFHALAPLSTGTDATVQALSELLQALDRLGQ